MGRERERDGVEGSHASSRSSPNSNPNHNRIEIATTGSVQWFPPIPVIPQRRSSNQGRGHQQSLLCRQKLPKVHPSKVNADVHFHNDLGLDSLDNVEIVMALEEEFKLEIPNKEADKIESYNLAIEYIYNHQLAG